MNPILMLSSAAVAALVSAVWQGMVLAAAVALGLRMLPRLSAAARSAIWLNVFGLLAALHLLPFLLGPQRAASPAHPTAVELDLRWSLPVAAVWLFLSLFRAGQLAASAARLRRLIARATEVEAGQRIEILLAGAPGRRVRLCVSEDVERPCVLGFFRPRILLPPKLMEALTPQELELVVAHEMEHLRRSDDWSNLVQKLTLMLFPLNPALLWVERRLCTERELACDDRVLDSSQGPKAYALCLARLAEFSLMHRGLALALGAWERRPELVRRIERIVHRPARRMCGRTARIASAGLVAGVLAGAFGLSRSPELVSFAPNADPALQTSIARAPEAAVSVSAPKPRLVKAIMPAPSVRAHRPSPRPVQTIQASSDLKPSVEEQTAAAPAPEPGLVVLTEFSHFDQFDSPPQIVFAVERVSRARYAAVPIAGGWLIVQI